MSVLPPRLPAAVRAQLEGVYADPEKFIRLLKVWDKPSKSYVPFVPNEEQLALLKALLAYRRIVVLKPRQIGVSSLLRAFAFWQVFTTGKPIRWGTVSFKNASSEELQGMDRGYLNSLPKTLTAHRKLKTDRVSTIEFDDTGAKTSTFTASGRYGTRSFALSDAHVSEFAFYPDPLELLATIEATVDTGQLVIESTPNVPGDAYHTLCVGAADGSNGWHLVTFWWWQHKRYRTDPPEDFVRTEDEEQEAQRYGLDDAQLYWRRLKIATMGWAKFRREYPGCMADAFAPGDGTYFTSAELDPIAELRFSTPDMVYEEARGDDLYVLGADVAGGVGGDYSTITVLSAATRQPVYQWRSNTVGPAAFAEKIVQVATRYGKARVLVESNNHGHVTIQRLQDLGYPNLWVSPQGKFWVTTAQSKMAAYEALREVVGHGVFAQLADVTLMELRSLVADTLAPAAPPGLHDDLAMSLALAVYALRSVPQAQLTSSRQARVDHALGMVRAKRVLNGPMPWRTGR